MTAHFTVRDIESNVIDAAQTSILRTADLVARALAALHVGCEVEVEFKPA